MALLVSHTYADIFMNSTRLSYYVCIVQTVIILGLHAMQVNSGMSMWRLTSTMWPRRTKLHLDQATILSLWMLQVAQEDFLLGNILVLGIRRAWIVCILVIHRVEHCTKLLPYMTLSFKVPTKIIWWVASFTRSTSMRCFVLVAFEHEWKRRLLQEQRLLC